MKKVLLFLAIGFIALTSCEETEEGPMYLEIDGVEYALSYGYIENNSSSSIGEFELSFGSSTYDPQNYLKFEPLTQSTSSLDEGTYVYKYWPSEPFDFDLPVIKTSDGHYMSESTHSWSGYITVSMLNDNFFFEFDLEATSYTDQSVTEITGEFNKLLSEGSIY